MYRFLLCLISQSIISHIKQIIHPREIKLLKGTFKKDTLKKKSDLALISPKKPEAIHYADLNTSSICRNMLSVF